MKKTSQKSTPLFITIIVAFLMFILFTLFANALTEQEETITRLTDRNRILTDRNEKSMKLGTYYEGYRSATRDIERLFWCENHANPPIECIHVFLKKQHPINLPSFTQ